ncbi:MAG: HAD-IC family P-type ATPase [Clostridia bacterium]|nr:HAD-IC family P-type ATPase [Clostridia bacterium]
MNKQVQRIQADTQVGLTAYQVGQRVSQKQTNKVKKVVGKSYLQIFTSNIFTFFNLLGFIIFILMAICKSISNMFFIVVILANTILGIFQEIRSKIAVEKLSIVSEPTAEVIRDGKQQTIAIKDIVLDDVILFSAGKQICADSIVLEGEVEVDESMLTGESDAVKKKAGDLIYSGSYIVTGSCVARVDKVGKDSYVEQLSARVKKAKTPDSRVLHGIRTVIKFISIIIFPLGIATFLTSSFIQTKLQGIDNVVAIYFANMFSNNLSGTAQTVVENVNSAVLQAAGSMIGMVPSGMVLLTSMTLAVAALKLALKKVLVRELPCIEMLARVDTLCMDKTGTITDGSMTVEQIIPLQLDTELLNQLVASVIAATGDKNTTATALSNHLSALTPLVSTSHLVFSSARKYSAAQIEGHGTVAIGAAEFMFANASADFTSQCDAYLKQGLRVLAVGQSTSPIVDEQVQNLEPIGIIVLSDTIRSDAVEIIRWFRENDVAVKVISGDNPISVSVIAAKVGVKDAGKYISLEGMTDEQVAQCANEYTVFGRVTPEQKAILVRSMKQNGHTVAMTGDGVNDILAMRESDCAISVGCGTDAAKTVANLVLMNNKFGSMPNVVAEGRQVVNNIQNSASLFLMKTCMTVFTTLLLLLIPNLDYPFEPKHLYAIEFFIIGIPSFLMALKPNRSLIKGSFLKNILKNTLPSGLAMFASVAFTFAFLNVWYTPLEGITQQNQITTVAMFAMTFTGLAALWILLFPYDWFNLGVGALSSLGTVAIFTLVPPLYEKLLGQSMDLFTPVGGSAVTFIILDVLVMAVIVIVGKLVMKLVAKRNATKE